MFANRLTSIEYDSKAYLRLISDGCETNELKRYDTITSKMWDIEVNCSYLLVASVIKERIVVLTLNLI